MHISQSLIKSVINKWGHRAEYCPQKLYRTRIFGDVDDPPTLTMNYGNLGEWMMTGMTRDGEEEPKIPRKQNGDPKAPERRIREQCADHLPNVLQNLSINIIEKQNVQVPVWKVFQHGETTALFNGHIDVFPTTILWDDEMRMAMIDIKWAGDVENTYGDFCWGEPWRMDHIQADAYQWLVRDFDIELNRKMEPEFDKRVGYHNIFHKPALKAIEKERLIFIYLIVGYNKEQLDKQVKIIQRTFYDEALDPVTGEIKLSNLRQLEFKERTRKAINELDYDEKQGWPLHATFKNCNTCPLSGMNGGDCKGYSLINKV